MFGLLKTTAGRAGPAAAAPQLGGAAPNIALALAAREQASARAMFGELHGSVLPPWAMCGSSPAAKDDLGDLPAHCTQSLALARNSNCPSDRWLDLVSPIIAEPNMVMINIGANKGYNVNSFLRRFQRGWSTTNAAWSAQLFAQKQFAQNNLTSRCGVCSACRVEVQLRYGRANVYVVAVEMAQSNSRNLQHLFEHFKVPGDVIHAAGGEQSGVAYEQPNITAGHEGSGISTRGIKIPMVTVDQIVEERKLESIDLLSIDTEGHDAPVLRGATTTLKKRLAKVVEFEYHCVGAWASEKLDHIISMMRRNRYTCFWQSVKGELSPFFPECAAAYEFRQWSNVVCATHPKVVMAFNMLVPERLQAAMA